MEAKTLAVLVGIGLLVAGLSGPVAGQTDAGAFETTSQPVARAEGPVDDVIAPTNGAPAFVLAGETLRVELATDVLGPEASSVDHVLLEASFGDGSVRTPATVLGVEASALWEGPYERDALAVDANLPAEVPAGLYDVVVPDANATAQRAVQVYEAWPDEPTIVMLADTQTGDPRAVEEGGAEAIGVNPREPGKAQPRVPPDPHPFNEAVDRMTGVDVVNVDVSPDERWAGYRAAIERINQIDPDLVLVSGDLTFGQLVPGSYHAEYEEAWALLNGEDGVDGTSYEGIHAPTLLAPGNHDGYVQTGEDGMEYWKAFFGPPAFARSHGEHTFLAVNTYDWEELDRMGFTAAVSAWGGQIRDVQLDWLRSELCQANGGVPVTSTTAIAGTDCLGEMDGKAITFAHHSPSWVQDEWRNRTQGFYENCSCAGTPVLDQAVRGIVTQQAKGQGWTGENRLELRETLREFDVDLHAAGHTHQDRIARDLGNGTIVETPQRPRGNLSMQQLHLVSPDGAAREIAYERGEQLVRHGAGPLYLETTTVASSTDEYLGLRELVWHENPDLRPTNQPGVGPFETGFAMTQPLLQELARRPGLFNTSHAELGLFSTPTLLEES